MKTVQEKAPPLAAETAGELFRQAARLVSGGLMLLRTTAAPCPHCRTQLGEDLPHFRVARSLGDLPDRLRAAADLADAAAQAPPQPSRGYALARRWYLERGMHGEPMAAELLAVLRDVAATGEDRYLADDVRARAEDLLRVCGAAGGNGATRPVAAK